MSDPEEVSPPPPFDCAITLHASVVVRLYAKTETEARDYLVKRKIEQVRKSLESCFVEASIRALELRIVDVSQR